MHPLIRIGSPWSLPSQKWFCKLLTNPCLPGSSHVDSAAGSSEIMNANLAWDAWAPGHLQAQPRPQGHVPPRQPAEVAYIMANIKVSCHIMSVMAPQCPACERDSVWIEQACQKCVSSRKRSPANIAHFSKVPEQGTCCIESKKKPM